MTTQRNQVSVPDTHGLICGFELHPEAAAVPLVRLDADHLGDAASAPVWLHFNLADARACNWIAGCEAMPEDAREAMLDADEHSRCERFGDGLLIVLGDLHHEFSGDPEEFGVLRVYIDRHRILTGRRHPLKSVDNLRLQLQRGMEIANPMELLIQLLSDLADSVHVVVKGLNDSVDDTEDDILADKIHDQRIELGRVRRLLARLRRHIHAGRTALMNGMGNLPKWCDEAGITDLKQAVQRLDALVQDVELVQERARLLQEEIAGRLGEATNRNLFILSIVTVVLLPINLITGIFGMNVGGLPFTDGGGGFWWVMICIVVAVLLSLRLMHSRRLF